MKRGLSDPENFIRETLGLILACYREFASGADALSRPGEDGKAWVRSSAADLARAAAESRIGRSLYFKIIA